MNSQVFYYEQTLFLEENEKSKSGVNDIHIFVVEHKKDRDT